MRLNSTMAVMAIVCVAVVMGGELRLGPLAKLMLAARNDADDHKHAPVAAVVVYDEPDVLNAYSLLGPVRLTGKNWTTDLGPDESGIPRLDNSSVADFGPNTFSVGGIRTGGLMALSTLNSAPATTDTTNPPNLTELPKTSDFLFTATASPPLAPTPEPATWVMMVLGIGGIGAALRHARVARGRI